MSPLLTRTFTFGPKQILVYTYVISHWGDVEQLGYIVQSLTIQNFFNALIALVVQSFMTARVWKLSNGSILLTGLLALFVLAEFVAVTVFSIIELQFQTYAQLMVLKPLSLVVNILAAVGDVLIAASLCFLLHRLRTGFQRSDTVISRLMLFALNTGLLTSLCALASFVLHLTFPNTFLYMMFYFCIGRLYTNSLLATLNVRKMVGDGLAMPMASFEFSKSGITPGSLSRPQHGTANIPIKIKTTTEYITDQKQDCHCGKIEYSQTSSSNVAVGFEGKSECIT